MLSNLETFSTTNVKSDENSITYIKKFEFRHLIMFDDFFELNMNKLKALF